MKIEVSLRDAANEPEVARPLVVALLCTLPQDEAELAVDEWRAVLRVQQADVEAWEEANSIKDTLPSVNGGLEVATVTPVVEQAKAPVLGPSTPLENCLSAKVAGPLKRAGFAVLGDLVGKSGVHLTKTVDRFGKGGLEEVQQVLASAGLDKVQQVLASAGLDQPAPRTAPQAAAPAQAVVAPATVSPPQLAPRGEDGLSLRELCRAKEYEVGREKVWAVLQKHGVTKLTEVGANLEAALRIDLAALA